MTPVAAETCERSEYFAQRTRRSERLIARDIGMVCFLQKIHFAPDSNRAATRATKCTLQAGSSFGYVAGHPHRKLQRFNLPQNLNEMELASAKDRPHTPKAEHLYIAHPRFSYALLWRKVAIRT